jgi:Uma2 family endonuclease
MQTTHINKLGSQVTQLSPVTWRTYENFLEDLGESYADRLSYSDGVLEIMSPSSTHGLYNADIQFFIYELCCATDKSCMALGNFTLKQDKLQKGIEPDNCYYIQNEPKVRHKQKIDLAQDIPPDLAIEIDISTDSTKKLDIYASLGVPELWFFDGDELVIYQLEQQNYKITKNSAIFPNLNLEAHILKLIELGYEIGHAQACKKLIEKIKQQGLI